MPQKIIGPFSATKGAGDLADCPGVDTCRLEQPIQGCSSFRCCFRRSKSLGVGLKVLNVVKPLLHDHMHERVEQGDVARGLELQHVGRVLAHRLRRADR